MQEALLRACREEPTVARHREALSRWLDTAEGPLAEGTRRQRQGVDGSRWLVRAIHEVLGPLAGGVVDVQVREGLLVAASDAGAPDATVWSTVERLRTGSAARVIRWARDGRLREVSLTDAAALLALLDGPPTPLEAVWGAAVCEPPPDGSGSGSLGQVRRLALTGPRHPVDVDPEIADAWVRRLPALEEVRTGVEPPAAMQRAWRARGIRRIAWWDGGSGPVRAAPQSADDPDGCVDRGGRGGAWIRSLAESGVWVWGRLHPRLSGLYLAARAGEPVVVDRWPGRERPEPAIMPTVPSPPPVWPSPRVSPVPTLAVHLERHLDDVLLEVPARRGLGPWLAPGVGGTRWAGWSSVGPRTSQEDALTGEGDCFALLDGMAGNSGILDALVPVSEALLGEGTGTERMARAHKALVAWGHRDGWIIGVGVSAMALQRHGSRVDITWIGDVSAGVWDGHRFRWVARPHHLWRLLPPGVKQRRFQRRLWNIVARVLGSDRPFEEPDSASVHLAPGERLVAMTSGVSDLLDGPNIGRVLAHAEDERDAVERVMAEVARIGPRANHTVLVLGPGDPPRTEP